MDTGNPVATKAIARAIGEELRRAREALGLSRAKFVVGLPSGIGERTLVAYEHGLSNVSIVRLMELCEHLGASAPEMLRRALQKAEIYLVNLTLQVDLRAFVRGANTRFRPMVPWAHNRMKDTQDGIIHLTSSAIRELAAWVGQPQEELAQYLARFSPDASQGMEAA
jgi:transcriptional regulator with XRE-family HTH domain